MLTQSFKGGNNLSPFEYKVDPHKGTVQVSSVGKVETFNIEDFVTVVTHSLYVTSLELKGAISITIYITSFLATAFYS